jgi:hypothetical protein
VVGSRSGGTLPGAGPLGPPKPPSPRMNTVKRLVQSGSPPSMVVSASTMTTAPLVLSKMSVTLPVVVTFAAVGKGRCRVRSCSPWRIIIGLMSIPSSTTIPMSAGNAGNTPKLGSTLRFCS